MRERTKGFPFAILALFCCSLAGFAVEYIAFKGITAENLIDAGGMYAPLVEKGQWHRLLTSVFLHGSYAHFAVNMLCLFAIGVRVEKEVGRLKTLFIFLFGGAIGNAAVYIAGTMRPQSLPPTVAVGSSGAIFALLGALVIFKALWPEAVEFTTMRRLLAGMFVIFLPGFLSPGMSLIGHAGGFIGGMASGVALALPKHAYARKPGPQELHAAT